MKIYIGDKVKLKNEIVDKEFDYNLPVDMEGTVANLLELPDETLVLFHPEGDVRIYAINVNSITK